MPEETPGLRRDSAEEYHRFLKRVEELEKQKAEQIAEGKEREAEILDEAAKEALEEELKRMRKTAAAAHRASAEQWRKGMGLDE